MPGVWRPLLVATTLVAAGQTVRDVDVLITRVFETSFDVAAPGEVVALIHAGGCLRCSWGAAGREAAALRVSVDGRYSQHLMLARGADFVEYPVTLGALGPG